METRITGPGTIITAKVVKNSALRPRKGIRARAYTAMELKTTLPVVTIAATRRLLKNQRAKGYSSLSTMFSKFSKVSLSRGTHRVLMSGVILKEVKTDQRKGPMVTMA